MKKMTRKLALLLVMALLISTCLFTLSACDDDDDDDNNEIETVATLNGKTPLEICREMNARLDSFTNVEVTNTAQIEIAAEAQGFSGSQTITMTSLAQANGETYYGKTTSESTGMDIWTEESEDWLVGGMYYERYESSDAEENYKTKTPMTYAQYEEMHGDEVENAFPIDIESGILDGVTFKKDGETYYFDIRLSGAQIYEVAGDIVEEFDGLVEFDTFTCRVSFSADGNLKGMNISFGGSSNQEGVSMTVTITMRATYKYGTVGTITPPADASSYKTENK